MTCAVLYSNCTEDISTVNMHDLLLRRNDMDKP